MNTCFFLIAVVVGAIMVMVMRKRNRHFYEQSPQPNTTVEQAAHVYYPDDALNMWP